MRHFVFLAVIILCTYIFSGSHAAFAENSQAQPRNSEESILTYSKEEMLSCIETSLARADESMTVRNLQDACKLLLAQKKTKDSSSPTDNIKLANEKAGNQTPDANQSSQDLPTIETTNVAAKDKENNKNLPQKRLLQDRLTMEALNRTNRFILTPNKRNYLMPVSYTDTPNTAPYYKAGSTLTDLNHTETELQLSVKILLRENIWDNNGHLYLGYTNHSLWQVYNRRISAPFRETDHQPELILSFSNDLEIFGFNNVLNEAILNHQSNGQTGLLSRSWNRVMLNSVFEKDNLTFAFNPWYRLPEDKAEYPGDPGGDDNPEITRYMGNYELSGAYKYKSAIFCVQFRNNFRSNSYGSSEISLTFPVTKTMRGYLNYFDGYGHSLIDYDFHQQIVGLGIIFTDLF